MSQGHQNPYLLQLMLQRSTLRVAKTEFIDIYDTLFHVHATDGRLMVVLVTRGFNAVFEFRFGPLLAGRPQFGSSLPNIKVHHDACILSVRRHFPMNYERKGRNRVPNSRAFVSLKFGSRNARRCRDEAGHIATSTRCSPRRQVRGRG